jgi:hypothetical protein
MLAQGKPDAALQHAMRHILHIPRLPHARNAIHAIPSNVSNKLDHNHMQVTDVTL